MTEEDLVKALFHLLRRDEPPGLQDQLIRLSLAGWKDLLATSLRLGVAPLLYDRIRRRSDLDSFPVDILEALKQAFHNNAAQNLIVRLQLEEILSILEAHQIPVILLKGAALAFTVYENPACRMMSDLDILVHGSDIPKLLTLLEGAGYRMSRPAWETPGHHLPPLVRPGVYLPLEVHWLLTNPNKTRNLSAETVWNASRSTQFSNGKFLSMPPTLFLFHLAQHASYHHRFINGVQAVSDIEVLAEHCREDLSFPAFLEYSEPTGCTRGTLLVIKLAMELLGARLPSEFVEYINRLDCPDAVMRSAYHSMLTAEELPDTPSRGTFSALSWWYAKVIKFSDSVRLLHQRTADRSVTNQSPLDFVNQLIRLTLSNISAAANQVKIKKQSEEIENYGRLRDWLEDSK